MNRNPVLILSLFVCLTGCTLAPKYTRPAGAIPDRVAQRSGLQRPRLPAGGADGRRPRVAGILY